MHIHQELDTRGLNCPLPILRTKKALNDMKSGQVVRIVATDPASVRDFEAFSRQTGNALLTGSSGDGCSAHCSSTARIVGDVRSSLSRLLAE